MIDNGEELHNLVPELYQSGLVLMFWLLKHSEMWVFHFPVDFEL